MKRVRDALAGLRESSEPFEKAYDGNMYVLSIASASGSSKDYSPQPTCNHSSFSKILGFDDVWKVVEGL